MKAALICLLSFFALGSFAQEVKLKTGDLLFQDLDCGSLCDAIEKVTYGADGMNFSHVGIVFFQNNQPMVIEALNGVAIVDLATFLNRVKDENGKPKVAVGRIKKEFAAKQGLNYKMALQKAHEFLGAEYDDGYELNNNKFYCSELVYETYLNGNSNPIFSTAPMTFVDPETKQTFPAWKEYFEKLGIPIPEGKLALNPGGMSKAPFLEIIYEYGNISKKLKIID